MNIFNVKWGIHIYVFLLLEQQNTSFETLLFFQFCSGELFRKAPGITPPPPMYIKLFSLQIWTIHKSDLNNFEKRRNQQIRGSLACLKMSLNNQHFENLFYEYLAFDT